MAPSVQITKAAALQTTTGQTDGMIRQGAIIDQSDKVCASGYIVYAARGHGTIVSEGGEKRQDLTPGDFALIPAFAEHQEVNDGEEEVQWVITRSGRMPVVENLEGWGRS